MASEVTRCRLQLLAVWLLLAAVLGGGLFVARERQGPLDDSDMAYERPGVLNAGDAVFSAPAVVAGEPARGQRAVVFFVRPEMAAEAVRSISSHSALTHRARALVVVSGTGAPAVATGVPVVTDPAGRLATGYRMRVPRDGGPPVGYAMVDREGLVRYSTLDPEAADRLDEVDTLLDALP